MPKPEPPSRSTYEAPEPPEVRKRRNLDFFDHLDERRVADEFDDGANDWIADHERYRRSPPRDRDWWAFSFPPNRPDDGSWRIGIGHLVVAGTQYRRDEVRRFVHEVEATQQQDQLDQFPFSVSLEAEPSNPHDRYAVKVLGT